MPDRLEGGLEINVLTLLAFSDKDFFTVRAKVNPEMFSLQAFKVIARKACEFIDKFNEPPKEHLYDLLEVELRTGDSSLIDKFLTEAPRNSERLNPAYVVETLHRFLRFSAIQAAIEKATEALTDEDLDTAEDALGNFSPRAPKQPFSRLASKIEPRVYEFIDTRKSEGRFPRGCLSIVAGDPGEGKSILMYDLAACVSNGLTFPGRARCGDPMKVGILQFEDAAEDTIVPRLITAIANLDNVHILAASQDDGRLFTIPNDLPRLEQFLKEYPGVECVAIDPVTCALSGKTDSHKDASLRQALNPAGILAQKYHIALICVMHMNKNVELAKAVYRVSGSIAFVGAPRAVYLVGRHPDDADLLKREQRRVLATVKYNLGPEPDPIVFRIKGRDVEIRKNLTVQHPFAEWDPNGGLDMRANDLLKEPSAKRGPKGELLEQAVASAERLFADGKEHLASELEAQAKLVPCSYDTYKRAALCLGAKASKSGFTGGWIWMPPLVATCNFPSSVNPLREKDPSEESKPLANLRSSKKVEGYVYKPRSYEQVIANIAKYRSKRTGDSLD